MKKYRTEKNTNKNNAHQKVYSGGASEKTTFRDVGCWVMVLTLSVALRP